MELPPGIPDPIYLCQLAARLHMPVGEMCSRMSAHELGVMWPAFNAWEVREAERRADRQQAEMERRRRGGR